MSRIQIPKNFMGVPVSEKTLQRVLEGGNSNDNGNVAPENSAPRPITAASNNLVDKDKYVFLEARQHGSYAYPDLLVAMDRTHLNKNWDEAWDGLKQEGAFMLTIRQYVDFVNLIRSGNAYDGNGNRIPEQQLRSIYSDIVEVKDPWRSEWLNAKFSKRTVGKTFGVIPKSGMYITYRNLKNGQLDDVSEELDDYLAKDQKIDLHSWLIDATNQGLPKPNVRDGSIHYWYPRDERVAWFVAGSVRASLYCVWDPAYGGSFLGVRAARAKI